MGRADLQLGRGGDVKRSIGSDRNHTLVTALVFVGLAQRLGEDLLAGDSKPR